MPDTLEKRVEYREQILAHLPEDLDARFAGVDVKLAGLREVLALHTTRFTKLETRFNDLERKVDSLERKVDGLTRDIRAGEERILAAIKANKP
jgi:chromosome segregation ATPase